MSQQRFLACVLVFCSLAWWSAQARAQSDFGQRIWWKSDHNAMSAEVNRTLGITSPSYPATGTPNVNGARFSNTAGQWPVATQKTNLPFPGKSAPIDVVARVKPASAAAALGRFAAKVATPLVVGVALYDLAKELGFDADNSGGELVVQKLGLPTDMWTVTYTTSGQQRQVRASGKDTACASQGHTWKLNPYQPGIYACFITTQYAYTPFKVANTYQPAALEPSNPQALQDAIAAQTGWPAESAASRAIADAIKNGEVIEYDPAAVSGPATKPGSSTVTQNPDGSTTTVVVNHNYTYNGPKVTVTTTTTTTNTTPGGTPSTTVSTDTEVAPDPTEEPEGVPTDTALPGQPELYTPEYPEGLKGVWNAKQAQLQALPILDLLTDLMPNVAASGTCPSWTLDMDLYIVDYGAHVIAIPCWIWDFGKVVIICSALLLSRRLIFGG